MHHEDCCWTKLVGVAISIAIGVGGYSIINHTECHHHRSRVWSTLPPAIVVVSHREHLSLCGIFILRKKPATSTSAGAGDSNIRIPSMCRTDNSNPRPSGVMDVAFVVAIVASLYRGRLRHQLSPVSK